MDNQTGCSGCSTCGCQKEAVADKVVRPAIVARDGEAVDVEVVERAYQYVKDAWRLADHLEGVLRLCPGTPAGPVVRLSQSLRGFCTQMAGLMDGRPPITPKADTPDQGR